MTSDLSLLTSAIQTPDEDVLVPEPARAPSFTAAVAALGLGETASKALRLNGKQPLEFALSSLAREKEALRNSVNSSVREARKRSSSEYTVELTETITGKSLFILALVTRTA